MWNFYNRCEQMWSSVLKRWSWLMGINAVIAVCIGSSKFLYLLAGAAIIYIKSSSSITDLFCQDQYINMVITLPCWNLPRSVMIELKLDARVKHSLIIFVLFTLKNIVYSITNLSTCCLEEMSDYLVTIFSE